LLERLGWATIQRWIRDSRLYAIDDNSLSLSRSRHVLGVEYSFSFDRLALSSPMLLSSPSLPVVPRYSDSLLIRRGATRWGNLGITTLFAEATSCQLEYKYLAKVTGRVEYYEKVRFLFSFRIPSIMDACMQVERIMDVFYTVNATDGLFADRWFDNGTPLGGTLLFFFLASFQITHHSPFYRRGDRR